MENVDDLKKDVINYLDNIVKNTKITTEEIQDFKEYLLKNPESMNESILSMAINRLNYILERELK